MQPSVSIVRRYYCAHSRMQCHMSCVLRYYEGRRLKVASFVVPRPTRLFPFGRSLIMGATDTISRPRGGLGRCQHARSVNGVRLFTARGVKVAAVESKSNVQAP